jgi:hypothetical protein
MADLPLKTALVAFALVTAGCDGRREVAPSGSITVKLPPPRMATSAPGFSFRGSAKPRG